MNAVIGQILEELSHPSIVPFIVAVGTGFFVYHVRDRRKMLSLKALMDGMYATYLFMSHAYAGAFSLGIAMLGGLVQIATPDHLMKKTLPVRLVVAIALAGLGAALTVQRTSDVLPLLATVISRFFEMHHSAQHIRLLMLIPLTMWMTYSIDNQFYVLTLAQLSLMSSQIFAALKVHKETQKEETQKSPS